ncbi:MAG: RraA family protein [Christensenellales bacterium]|jgi:4-hydroxy-4-methyl-2-oxoglutarate aldolase
MNDIQLLEDLKKFDTPSITNVVATYPGNEYCLSLYSPWQTNWYTDQSVKCMYPELGRVAGYAVTAVYGMPSPGEDSLSFRDVLQAIGNVGKPTVLVIKQDLPEAYKAKSGLCGGNMTTAFKALGTVGVVSDGPSRDIDEIRPMKVQYLLTGVTAGHGPYAIKAVNVPVSVCGMDVSPGEIIHMDENGAVKFPAEKLEQVVDFAIKLQQKEAGMQQAMARATDADEIFRIFSGDYK